MTVSIHLHYLDIDVYHYTTTLKQIKMARNKVI